VIKYYRASAERQKGKGVWSGRGGGKKERVPGSGRFEGEPRLRPRHFLKTLLPL